MYGLIGKKLSHSFSADFFNKKFEKEGLNETYNLFPIPEIKDFPKLLELHSDLKGLNVTIPYKQEIIPFLNDISEEAEAIGAVNVVKIFEKDGTKYLKGYNSDVYGFKESLRPLLNENIKNALVLGTGGASKAVVFVLKQLGITPTLVSRNKGERTITYDDINEEILKENLLIVNTTPLGMFPDISSFPPIPYHFLSDKHICFDLVYNPLETEFLKRSKDKGASVKNGLEMLHLQALKAWDIWNES